MTNRFDTEAVRWDEEPRRVRLAETIVEGMVRRLALTGREIVLDYGTGTGLIAINLRPRVGKIIAVDSSSGMLAVLKQKLERSGIDTIEPREWSIGQSTESLPRFDLIVSSMTLHHVKDTVAAAEVFGSLLGAGGRIAVADLDEENGEFHSDPLATEHNGFNRCVLQGIFEKAGFSSIQFYDAATIVKPLPDGRERPFTVFLMTGVKK